MKRPDQYQIDPGEGGATDYKNLPQTGRGHSNRDDTVELDRQRHAQAAEEAKRGPAPAPDPAPSKDANRPVRAKNKDDEVTSSEPGAADADSAKENPLA